MHLFHIAQCSIQSRNVHISVLNGALWDMEQVHSGICEIGLSKIIRDVRRFPEKGSTRLFPVHIADSRSREWRQRNRKTYFSGHRFARSVDLIDNRGTPKRSLLCCISAKLHHYMHHIVVFMRTMAQHVNMSQMKQKIPSVIVLTRPV